MENEILDQAADVLVGLETQVFFHKLAAYGIQPETEEEMRQYLAYGNQMLAKYPITDDRSVQIKQASAASMGGQFKFAENGFSEEANSYVDVLMGDPGAVEAAMVFLNAQTL